MGRCGKKIHVALVDSTGHGLAQGPDSATGVHVEPDCVYIVSPGSSLHRKGYKRGQTSLAHAVAREEHKSLKDFLLLMVN